jgi:hypothetical protein
MQWSPFYVRHGDHCCHVDLVGRTTFWIFLSGLQNLNQLTKMCIELRGENVEKPQSLVAWLFFFLVGLRAD